ncbi:Protein N-acetyltransferase, RimJ/RimL family [Nonlabens sp. Hel1_33_55]|uniref:GNAT family N-acetyltransferase n=1 Tax=Nonlabens sp. Hel1_33_55 TaxID=1336802 RepID=UPI000875C0DE|nr:GNAT family N-acetyltransferase [Nonlabens sp. Hel1_33_55]SCY04074.1 Protein N-acetyltransferase, RimJ/RimL family [Nonlabens sp. Hel1_33_55]
MKIFETDRLEVRRITEFDKDNFAELITNPVILEKIPVKPASKEIVADRYAKAMKIELSDIGMKKCFFGIIEKGKDEVIGLALFLINDIKRQELGYRFRPEYWGNGYGTEIAKGMLNYYFDVLEATKVTAGANATNEASVKILSKFMKPIEEVYNEEQNYTDIRFEISKNDWMNRKGII